MTPKSEAGHMRFCEACNRIQSHTSCIVCDEPTKVFEPREIRFHGPTLTTAIHGGEFMEAITELPETYALPGFFLKRQVGER